MLKKNLIPVIAVFLFLAASCSSSAKPDPECTSAGFFSSPQAIIDAFPADSNLTPERAYILARAYRDSRDYKKAILYYANSSFSSHRNYSIRLFPGPVYNFMRGFHFKSDLYEDAAFQIGTLFYEYREFDYSVRFAELVSKKHRGLYREAKLLQAQSLIAMNKPAEARDLLAKLSPEYPDSTILSIRLVSAMLKSGAYNDAYSQTMMLLKKEKPSWATEIALGQLKDIIDKGNIKLTEDDTLVYARSLYDIKDYKASLNLLNNIKPDFKSESGELFLRLLCREDKKTELTTLLKSLPDPADSVRQKLVAADEFRNMSSWNNALPLYQDVDRSGIEPYSREALRKICRHMLNKKIAGYPSVLQTWISRYPDEADTGEFLWAIARMDIKTSPVKAAARLSESIRRFPDGEESDACRFWLYKFSLSQKDLGSPDSILSDMIIHNPDSAYTWRLMDKLTGSLSKDSLEKEYRDALLKKDEKKAIIKHTLLFAIDHDRTACTRRMSEMKLFESLKPFIALENDIVKPVFPEPIRKSFNRIEKYFSIGCMEEYTREIESLPSGKDWDDAKNINSASLAVRYNQPYLSVLYFIKMLHTRKVEANIAVLGDLSRKSLYPEAFSDHVKKYSSQYNINPSLIYAVMKAESLFNYSVISSAGAVGLMQLMPATAEGIAREISLTGYSLTDTETSIRLGSHYLAWLNKYYKSDQDKMVAAYNAGAGNVNRWIKEMGVTDPDLFAEFTPFEETRGYILRTGKFHIQYRLLYGGK